MTPKDEIIEETEYVVKDEEPQEEKEPQEDANDSFFASPKKKRPKKRLRRPETWKKNVIKTSREAGKSYVGYNNRNVPARISNGKCSTGNCYLHCEKNIPPEERKKIFDTFWALTNEKKNHFYSKFVHRQAAKRKKAEGSLRCYTFQYFFKTDENVFQVCREFFTSTLNISQRRIYYCFSGGRPGNGGVTKRK